MSLTISDYGNVLKNWYRGPIIDLLTKRRILLRFIKRDGDKSNFHGNVVHCPVHTGRNLGVGSRLEGQELPAAGKQSHEVAKYNVKYNYARINLTGPVMAASGDTIGAFAKALNVEMAGAMQDALEEQQRQVWGNGSGILTNCGTTASGNTVTVKSTKRLAVGMPIDVLKIDDGTVVATNITVATIPSATTFTFTGSAIATTDNVHAIYHAGSRITTSWGTPADLWGLETLVDDTDIKATHGFTYNVGQLDRATVEKWKANKVTAGAALSFTNMQQAWDEVDEAGESDPKLILTSYAGRRAYAALFATNRRYNNVMRLRGGFTGLEFNGVGVFADRNASLTADPTDGSFKRLYFLNLKDFSYYVKQEWDWIDQGGDVLHWVTGYDAYEAVLRSYMQFAIKRPVGQCVLIVTDSI